MVKPSLSFTTTSSFKHITESNVQRQFSLTSEADEHMTGCRRFTSTSLLSSLGSILSSFSSVAKNQFYVISTVEIRFGIVVNNKKKLATSTAHIHAKLDVSNDIM